MCLSYRLSLRNGLTIIKRYFWRRWTRWSRFTISQHYDLFISTFSFVYSPSFSSATCFLGYSRFTRFFFSVFGFSACVFLALIFYSDLACGIDCFIFILLIDRLEKMSSRQGGESIGRGSILPSSLLNTERVTNLTTKRPSKCYSGMNALVPLIRPWSRLETSCTLD